MTRATERRLLQIAIAFACLVPITAGLGGVVFGAAGLDAGGIRNLDSHVRYLSGLLLGIGLSYVSLIPHIEKHAASMKMLTIIVFIGGLGRLLGWVEMGAPGGIMKAALLMELVIAPVICLWQWRVSSYFREGSAAS